MTYTDYRAQLLATMHDFARQYPPDLFDSDLANPNRPPVFRPEYADENLIVPADQALATGVRASVPASARHRWFGSLMSSQALAQSVFGALIAAGRLDLLSGVAAEDGSPAFGDLGDPHEARLEKAVDWLGELDGRGTSVDVFFQSSRYRVAVECKLTERDFGACSRPGLEEDNPDLCDGSYSVQLDRRTRCSLTERGIQYWTYVPQILGWAADDDHMPCPVRFTYQLVRNLLAALVHDGAVRFDGGHAVVVYDARNPRFQGLGTACIAFDQVTEALGGHRSRLRAVSWQSIIQAISVADEFDYLVAGLAAKYGLTGSESAPSVVAASEAAIPPPRVERLRESLRYSRMVLLRVATDGGVLEQLEQRSDRDLAALDTAQVEQLRGRLAEAAELVREIRADDLPPLLH